MTAKGQARAAELAAAVVDVFAAHVSRPRSELDEATVAIPCAAAERVLLLGLVKLASDLCTFGADPDDLQHDDDDARPATGTAPDALRLSLFERAAVLRKLDAPFDRGAVLAAEAAARGIDVAALEARLYADLPEAQTLDAAPPITAAALVDRWQEARAQAVLLRAVRVTVDVRCAQAGGYRALFRKLKFLQLLWTIERTDDGWRLVVDGPLAMFSSSTRYGLKLAMLLPALDACEAYALTADVRWGKERAPYAFKHRGGCGAAADDALPDDVRVLAAALQRESDRFDVDTAPDLVELPGRGVVVPDLSLVDKKTGEVVHVELLGHWSREAVWKRVELVEQGLPARVVFCASDRLRVGEAGLEEGAASCLYVYKGRPSAKRLLERVALLAPPGKRRAKKQTTRGA